MAVKSLSERTADRLYDMIVLDQTLQPGEKLPNENELSVQLGVSRATLREAIRLLSAQGVLEVRRGRGTYVAEALHDADFGLKELDRAHMRLKDLFEMRLMFEPQCIALACERATDEELLYIRAQGERVQHELQNGGDWAGSDQLFHTLISKASHNEFMIRLFPIINSAVQQTMEIAQNLNVLADLAVSDNRLIMEFLAMRDAKGASCAMNLHIRHIINALGLNKRK